MPGLRLVRPPTDVDPSLSDLADMGRFHWHDGACGRLVLASSRLHCALRRTAHAAGGGGSGSGGPGAAGDAIARVICWRLTRSCRLLLAGPMNPEMSARGQQMFSTTAAASAAIFAIAASFLADDPFPLSPRFLLAVATACQ